MGSVLAATDSGASSIRSATEVQTMGDARYELGMQTRTQTSRAEWQQANRALA